MVEDFRIHPAYILEIDCCPKFFKKQFQKTKIKKFSFNLLSRMRQCHE